MPVWPVNSDWMAVLCRNGRTLGVKRNATGDILLPYVEIDHKQSSAHLTGLAGRYIRGIRFRGGYRSETEAAGAI